MGCSRTRSRISNVALKWRNIASPGALVKLSTLFPPPGVAGLSRTGFNLRIKEDLAPSATLKVLIEKGVSAATETTPSAGLGGTKVKRTKRLQQDLDFSSLFYSFRCSLLRSPSFFSHSKCMKVHEKTILVPLLPLTLIMVGASGNTESTTWELGMLTNNVAVFS